MNDTESEVSRSQEHSLRITERLWVQWLRGTAVTAGSDYQMQSIARADRVGCGERRDGSESSRESGVESETLFNTLWSLNMSLLHQEPHSAASPKGLRITGDPVLCDRVPAHLVDPKRAIQLLAVPYAFPRLSASTVIAVAF